MELIKIYDNKNVTILTIDNVCWFKGKDVASVLGYVNTKDTIKNHVRDKHKMLFGDLKLKLDGVANHVPTKKLDSTVYISEPGLYSLILRSKLKGAENFQDWVTEVVLPSIRKTGEYKINKHEQNKLIIGNIQEGVKLMDYLGVLNPLDKLYFGSQVKNILKEDNKTITNNEIEYPLTRRLHDLGIKYNSKDKSKLIKAGTMLSKLYFNKYGKRPIKRNQDVGGRVTEVNIYTNKDFDIMDKVLEQFFQ